MIPKNIFFIFGLREDFCGKPFDYFHYLNILSAKICNPDYQIYVYYHYKPESIYFEKLKKFCKLVKIKDFDSLINQYKYKFGEQLAGRIRLQLLNDYGGVYLDTDVVCCKSFNDLLSDDCVMCEEYGPFDGKQQLAGLCDAIILSRPNSGFIRKWIQGYETDYRENWNYNAVKMPLHIAQDNPNLITRLDTKSFFKFQWDEVGASQLFSENHDFSECYCIHLWESINYKFLIKYNRDYILQNNNTLSNVYKKILRAKYYNKINKT